jgi:hypothetical protein
MNIAKHMYGLFIHKKILKSIALFDTLFLNPLKWKLQLKQGFKLLKKIQKTIYIISNLFKWIFLLD